MKNSHATHFDAIHFGNVLLILLIRIRIAHFCCCISICLSKQIQSIRKLFGCDGFWLRRISVEMSNLSKIKCKFSFCLLSTTQCLYKRRVDFLTVSREVQNVMSSDKSVELKQAHSAHVHQFKANMSIHPYLACKMHDEFDNFPANKESLRKYRFEKAFAAIVYICNGWNLSLVMAKWIRIKWFVKMTNVGDLWMLIQCIQRFVVCFYVNDISSSSNNKQEWKKIAARWAVN